MYLRNRFVLCILRMSHFVVLNEATFLNKIQVRLATHVEVS